MSLLSLIARVLLLRRLLGRGARHGRGRAYSRAYGGAHPRRYSRPYARPPARRRGRVGFFGPVPYYSRRTRGGGRVSIGGCCLPIPLALSVMLGVVGRLLAARH